MRPLFYFGMVTFLLAGCNKCKDIICSPPLPSFELVLIDKFSQEDLFLSGQLDSASIEITNTTLNQPVPFLFQSNKTTMLSSIFMNGLETGIMEYQIKVEPDITINITSEIIEGQKDCCRYYETVNFVVSQHEFEYSSGKYLIQINPLIGRWDWLKSIAARGGYETNPATEGYTMLLNFKNDSIYEVFKDSSLYLTYPYSFRYIKHSMPDPNSDSTLYLYLNNWIEGAYTMLFDSLIFDMRGVDGPAIYFVKDY